MVTYIFGQPWDIAQVQGNRKRVCVCLKVSERLGEGAKKREVGKEKNRERLMKE